ncbi:hypothetical protein AJ79_03105 [Helicocarpus griseus UAMH5409]|uniref:Uncharacterized protein n=1 Tax=Helicocarpus griseus UAMH5409 TaxID=1447875 RepID=A0A2B7XZS4_9EURO|nr:hypothetical protein AJ79_03105 [Helicocarpus griseus UAMH5409]
MNPNPESPALQIKSAQGALHVPIILPESSPQHSTTSSSTTASRSSTPLSIYGPPSPPPKPVPWVWRCHLCQTQYPLGVTNRCLIDGHRYCSGHIAGKNTKSERRQGPCTSDFDYPGWSRMNAWQKKVSGAYGDKGRWAHGCFRDCIFPSACLHIPRLQMLGISHLSLKDGAESGGGSSTPKESSNPSPANSSSPLKPEAKKRYMVAGKRARPESTASLLDAPVLKRRKLSNASGRCPTLADTSGVLNRLSAGALNC